MNRLIALAFVFILALATPAPAQSVFPTPNGTTSAGGTILMCPKAGSNPVTYVPCDATNPAAVSGTFTPSGTQNVALPTTGTIAAGNGVVAVPSSETGAGITPIASAALESNKVIKATSGNFYSGYITTGATAGWLLLANSAAAPTAGGAAIAPLACVLAPANQTTSISAPGAIPMVFSNGITMVFSTSGCLTNTASTTAFFSGLAK